MNGATKPGAFELPADDFDAYLADMGSEEEESLELSDSEVRL